MLVSFVSLFIAVVSVLISAISLLLSNRPYIDVTIMLINGRRYMRLKNYGNQTALVKSVVYNTDLTEQYFSRESSLPLPFVGDEFTVAPSQSHFAHLTNSFIDIEYEIRYTNRLLTFKKKGKLSGLKGINFIATEDREFINTLL
ncbi:hypothetical protein DES51_111140 [Dielma fastidiosa]|uniref:Uncharacterized protein n=2 Tax=Dielma fastidiosa TaxID=1034346 RepID=A0A318KL68_9FIRM|nr:hypothetical protein DES51_111140 [Dielma fastidiosa]